MTYIIGHSKGKNPRVLSFPDYILQTTTSTRYSDKSRIGVCLSGS